MSSWLKSSVLFSLLPSLVFGLRANNNLFRFHSLNGSKVQAEPSDDLFYTQQSVDHFDNQNLNTFSQRYFVNDTFFQRGNRQGPVFLCVGGEGPPLDNSVVVSSVHCNDAVELADRLNALIVAVEHRYYGKSIPTPDLSTSSLKFLSANQALADLNQFQGWFSNEWSLDEKINKWVSFGGSYPGMLAGWYRLQFPSSVVGAVSSSAPVKAQLNFQGYNDVVFSALSNSLVNGSSACAQAIKDGHAAIIPLLQTEEGRTDLAKRFNLCDNGKALLDTNNVADWAGNGVISIPAQTNDPSCDYPACDIGRICSIMSSYTSSPLDGLTAVYKTQFGSSNTCISLNHDLSVQSLLNTTLEGGTDRVWFYQTCSEFGFYQTCEVNTNCPYTQGYNVLSTQTELCKIAFNIDEDSIQKHINESNVYWGGDKPQGSNIFYVNGDVDPWHYLSVNESPNPSEPILMVYGASHHFWTHPSLPTDSATVIAAREQIASVVTGWLTK